MILLNGQSNGESVRLLTCSVALFMASTTSASLWIGKLAPFPGSCLSTYVHPCTALFTTRTYMNLPKLLFKQQFYTVSKMAICYYRVIESVGTTFIVIFGRNCFVLFIHGIAMDFSEFATSAKTNW